jgi:hypothetical protein
MFGVVHLVYLGVHLVDFLLTMCLVMSCELLFFALLKIESECLHFTYLVCRISLSVC